MYILEYTINNYYYTIIIIIPQLISLIQLLMQLIGVGSVKAIQASIARSQGYLISRHIQQFRAFFYLRH